MVCLLLNNYMNRFVSQQYSLQHAYVYLVFLSVIQETQMVSRPVTGAMFAQKRHVGPWE